MCLLLAVRDVAQGRLWVAANRDERLSRPWRAPSLVSNDPPVFAGVDQQAGGSWLAVNLAAGFVAGVTNARLGAPAGERSRGQLVLDVAAQPSLPAAVAVLTEMDLSHFGAFNLLLVDARDAFVATNYPEPKIERLEGPLIALGNDPLGSQGGRTRTARLALATRVEGGDELIPSLQELLADHSGVDPICRHFGPFGTVSSTVCALTGGRLTTYLFAPGPPCRTLFAPLPLPPLPYS